MAEHLREHFAEHEIVELTLVAGATLMLNRLCTALELPTSAATLARLQAEGVAPR
jgi:alkylhydroperoxidase family enzyme